jgi:hypothetical protein
VIRKRSRQVAIALIGLLLVMIGVIATGALRNSPTLPPRPPGEGPKLLLLTSLPIVFPEGLTLKSRPSPVRKALQSRYTVVPISIADSSSLGAHRLLLMAQPQAQPADVLVELDEWVRRGGRVLLLADPALQWPSNRPIGSSLRPPFAFADTGLLGHWGLRLDAPEELGAKSIRVDGVRIRTQSPGTLVATAGNCIVENGFVASCRIGKGAVTIISDADFIKTADSRDENLQLLLRELARLER